MATNEVTIEVKVDRDKARLGFAAVEADAKRSGEKSGDTLRTGLSGKLISLASGIGSKIAEGVGELGAKIGPVLGKVVGSLPPIGQALAPVLIGGLAVSLAPLMAAAISSALLFAVGGGVLALGIKAAIDNPGVAKAFEGLGKKAKSAFDGFGQPFEAPLKRAAQTFSAAIGPIGSRLKEMGSIIAPVIDKLAPALVSFIKNTLPGIQSAVQGSVPLFNTLAEKLPLIGSAISDFFTSISENGDDTTMFFSDLLDVVAGLIGLLGDLIGWIAGFYVAWRKALESTTKAMTSFARSAIGVFGGVLDAAVAALSWVPGLGGKLKAAQGHFKDFAKGANRWLDSIDKSVTVRVTIEQVFTQVGHALTGLAAQLAHHASGGVAGGLSVINEQGGEIVKLPNGSMVYPAGQSKQMMQSAGGGGGSQVNIKFDVSSGPPIVAAMFEVLREGIRAQGGNVQQVLGVTGR